MTSLIDVGLGLEAAGHTVQGGHFFDTIKVKPSCGVDDVRERAAEKEINLRYFEDGWVSPAPSSRASRDSKCVPCFMSGALLRLPQNYEDKKCCKICCNKAVYKACM